MKPWKPTLSLFRSVVLVVLLLASACSKLDATLYVSNLTNQFNDGGIGIGSNLFPGRNYFLANFRTGAGSYSLNSVVLEFGQFFGPNSWTNVDVDLYQVIGNQPLPIVPLGRPTTNSMPTQWPRNTVFVDFHPNWQTTLQPFTQYQATLRVPIQNSPAALLFCVVTNYASFAGWQMGPGLLKLAVDATLIEDQLAYTNFTYATNDRALTIESSGGAGGPVSIPAMVYGMPVVSIGRGAFGSDSNLLSISIPNTVSSIEDDAFVSCVNLTDLFIPASVTNLGSSVFQGCTSLTNISVGVSVKAIGDNAFDFCSNLTTITVDPFNATYSSVNGVLFNQARTKLIRCPEGKTGVYTIPNGVTNIANGAFANCRMTNVIIPGTVTSLGDGVFGGCTNLLGITVPGSVTSIGAGVFSNCSTLTTVCFRGNIPTSGSLVFENAANATVYYLPGTMGWSTNFDGRPAWRWNPIVITGDRVFGARSNRFGFNITGTPSLLVLVEGTTNLAQGSWVPLRTISLTNGSFYFQDLHWTNYPARIYRLRSP